MFFRWFSLLMLKGPFFKAPYTDPTTGLRYHDKSVFEVIKGLVSIYPIFPFFELILPLQSPSVAKEYLAGTYFSEALVRFVRPSFPARGVHSILK